MTTLDGCGQKDQNQWYRLPNGMFTGGVRQEVMNQRNWSALIPQLPQGAPAQLQLQLPLRDTQLPVPSEMLPVGARQYLGHLSPPLAYQPCSMAPTGYSVSGHRIPHSKTMAMVARQQENMHKRIMARLEINSILEGKQQESAQRNGLIGLGYPIIHQDRGIPQKAISFSGSHLLPEGPLSTVIQHKPPRKSQATNPPYLPISKLQRERMRRAQSMAANHCGAHKLMGGQPEYISQWEDRNMEDYREELVTAGEGGMGGDDQSEAGPRAPLLSIHKRSSLDNESQNCSGQNNCVNISTEREMPEHTCLALPEMQLCSSPFAQLTKLPYLCPAPENGPLSAVRKWTVEDVYTFIKDIPGCSEYAGVFRDHAIDGEALPLLSDAHLLGTLGVKLGPALKIRSQVFRYLHNAVDVSTNVPNAVQNSGPEGVSETSSQPPSCDSVQLAGSHCSDAKV